MKRQPSTIAATDTSITMDVAAMDPSGFTAMVVVKKGERNANSDIGTVKDGRALM